MKPMERITSKFTAKDAHGAEYSISIVQRYHHSATELSPDAISPDVVEKLRTEDGLHVNRIDQGQYEIIDGTDVIPVRSDDPSAP